MRRNAVDNAHAIEQLESRLIAQRVKHLDQVLAEQANGDEALQERRKATLNPLAQLMMSVGVEAGATFSLADSTALGDGKASLWLHLPQYEAVLRATAAVQRARKVRGRESRIPPTRLFVVKDRVHPVDANCLLELLRWHTVRGIRCGIIPGNALPREARKGIVCIPGKAAVLIPALEKGGACETMTHRDTHTVRKVEELLEDGVIPRATIVESPEDLGVVGCQMGLDCPGDQEGSNICFLGAGKRRGHSYVVVIDGHSRRLTAAAYKTLLRLIELGLQRGPTEMSNLDSLLDFDQRAQQTGKYHPAYKKTETLRKQLKPVFDKLVRTEGKHARFAVSPSRITIVPMTISNTRETDPVQRAYFGPLIDGRETGS